MKSIGLLVAETILILDKRFLSVTFLGIGAEFYESSKWVRLSLGAFLIQYFLRSVWFGSDPLYTICPSTCQEW